MPGYNKNFELTIRDIELIEQALRTEKRIVLEVDDSSTGHKATEIQKLLGRLHNQKIFYRPDGTYISG